MCYCAKELREFEVFTILYVRNPSKSVMCASSHLIEGGADLRYIQELLGYMSSKTTEMYMRVSNRDIVGIKKVHWTR